MKLQVLQAEIYIGLFDGTLSLSYEFMLSLDDETLSPFGEVLDLSGITSIKPSDMIFKLSLLD